MRSLIMIIFFIEICLYPLAFWPRLAILEALEEAGLSISNCISQAYNRTRNKSKRFLKLSQTIYAHCRAQALDLSLTKNCMRVQAISLS